MTEKQPTDVMLDGFPVAAAAPRRDELAELADEFARRVRKGDEPSIEDYVARCPGQADAIRETFPTIAALEQWKVDKETDCLRRNLPEKLKLEAVGRWRIVREIGRGGMGVVLQAVDDRTGRRVALKLLPFRSGVALDRWRARFQREAETIARLRHSNIVSVFEFGEHEGYWYYVMQLVNGVSLDRVIRRLQESADVVYADEIVGLGLRPDQTISALHDAAATRRLSRTSWQGFAKICCQAAQALHFAHQQGVLHNDVKPGNLLLDASGRVLVGDFGLARTVAEDEADEPETEDQGISGTLRFMAPERFGGRGDARSDVYSLGLTLYELATRTPAFAAPTRLELIERIRTCEIALPRDVNAVVPRPLETIIRVACAADPADRYRTAAQMAADLLRYIGGSPPRRRPPALLKKLWRRLVRRTAQPPERSQSDPTH